MSELKVLNGGEKFSHVSVGSIRSFEGKQFVKDATGATSCEISFGTLPTGVEGTMRRSYFLANKFQGPES